MVIRLLLALFFITSSASASVITTNFKARKYQAISDYYRDNINKKFTRKEMALISFSLRKLGFYRQDVKLNIKLVNLYYRQSHQKLLKAIKRGDTIDSDKYPKALPVLYWNIFSSYGAILKGYNHDSKLVEKDHKHFKLFSKILSELEFRESKVDKFNDLIIAHRQYLQDKIYRFKSSLTFQYVSWQNEATITNSATNAEANLNITNRGLCLGGDIGVENHLFHFYLDGCLLYGAGNVKNIDTSVIAEYEQQNVPALGFKGGPGMSFIVSSSKSRLGFKIPIIYSTQRLENATKDGVSYEIKPESPMSILTTVYSRWQFDKWYIQTEFGKYVSKELTYWGLGVGKEF